MFYNEFRTIGIEVPLGAKGKKKVVCPKCSERKGGTKDRDLSVDLDNGLYKCHSAKCDFKGSVRTLKRQYSRPQKRNTTTLTNTAVQYFQKSRNWTKNVNQFRNYNRWKRKYRVQLLQR